MNRRRFLSGVAGATPLLAGCNDNGDSSTPDGQEQNPNESTQFDEHIRPHTTAAMDAFEDAVGALTSEAGAFDTIEPGGVDHDVSRTLSDVSGHLSEAKDRLGTASNADYSYLFSWYVFGMQEFARWLSRFREFLERAATSHDAWETTHSRWPPQDFESIRGVIAEAYAARKIRHYPTGWEPPAETAEQLERFDLEAFDQLDAWAQSLEQSFSTLAEWGRALGVTGIGLSTIAEGLPRYLEAVTRYENQRYEGRTNEVDGVAETALGKFEEAHAYLTEHRGSIPSIYESTYESYVCYAESMVEAATLRIEASRAAADGDMGTARTKTREAQSARNSCPITN